MTRFLGLFVGYGVGGKEFDPLKFILSDSTMCVWLNNVCLTKKINRAVNCMYVNVT